MPDLKSCPFCGYEAVERETLPGEHVIFCKGCGAIGPSHDCRQIYDKELRRFLWDFRTGGRMIRPKPEPIYDQAYFDFVENLE